MPSPASRRRRNRAETGAAVDDLVGIVEATLADFLVADVVVAHGEVQYVVAGHYSCKQLAVAAAGGILLEIKTLFADTSAICQIYAKTICKKTIKPKNKGEFVAKNILKFLAQYYRGYQKIYRNVIQNMQ